MRGVHESDGYIGTERPTKVLEMYPGHGPGTFCLVEGGSGGGQMAICFNPPLSQPYVTLLRHRGRPSGTRRTWVVFSCWVGRRGAVGV